MKKFAILILSVALFSCAQQKGYKINVALEGAEGKVLLEQLKEGSLVPVDTVELVDGVAIFEGEVDYPQPHYISILDEQAKAIVFVENTAMSVTGKADSINLVEVTGSQTHIEFKGVVDEITRIRQEYMGLYGEAQQANATGDTAKSRELMERVQSLYESTDDLQVEFVKNNPASWAAPIFLRQQQNLIEIEELEEIVSSLDPKLDVVDVVQSVKERLEKLKTVAVGQTAPDFTQNDPDGNPVTFSEYYSKNELTLLDFWAAWCGPCRAENPNVVAVYNEFKDQGFNVIGVSLDRDKEAWLKAIKDDGLPWTQVSDLGYWQNEVSQMYAIMSIPSSLIVDKNGKIVARDKRGEDLRKTVAELLAK